MRLAFVLLSLFIMSCSSTHAGRRPCEIAAHGPDWRLGLQRRESRRLLPNASGAQPDDESVSHLQPRELSAGPLGKQ